MSLPPPPPDRGYLNLVSHLNASNTTIPLRTIAASIAHYLPRAQPSATPLAAIVVSSPLFRPPSQSTPGDDSKTYEALDALFTALRHAAHIKLKLLNEEPSGFWERSVKSRFQSWVVEVVKGLDGARPAVRLAALAGLLAGLGDLSTEEHSFVGDGRARRRVEEEVVIALAEVVESAPSASASQDPWEREFRSRAQGDAAVLPVALVLASRAVPLVALHRLKALPLLNLCSILQSSIASAFQDGQFLQQRLDIPSPAGPSTSTVSLTIPSASPFAKNVDTLSKSLLLTNMASLSALYVLLLSVLSEHRPATETWSAVNSMLDSLRTLTKKVDESWVGHSLASVEDDSILDSETKATATQVWTILKTLLFTCIRLSQQALTTALFIPSPTPSSPIASDSSITSLPFAIALSSLATLSHLSFVLPSFGSVSSTSSSSLPELLKSFYTALDILSSSSPSSAEFVSLLRKEVDGLRGKAMNRNILRAKEAFALACIEQLVPVLEDATIRDEVWPVCEPHLNDPSHRETYESAHSVMLAVLSSHAKRAESSSPSPSPDEEVVIPFAEQIVPMYANFLIENSYPDKLTSTQLRLAYRALVACANAFGVRQNAKYLSKGSEDVAYAQSSVTAENVPDGNAYAWFCIELLLSAIQSVPSADHERKKNLTLALVSTVSSVSSRLLPRLLEEVVRVLQEQRSQALAHGAVEPDQQEDVDEERTEMVHTLFDELLNVGDEQRPFVLHWWSMNKHRLGRVLIEQPDSASIERVVEGTSKGKAKDTAARL